VLGVYVLKVMARPRRAERDKYGETKQRYQIMLTETASAEVDRIADELGITRSEVFERMIRNGGLQLAKTDDLELEIA
jgi:predicted ArsR family transcriptional regulator